MFTHLNLIGKVSDTQQSQLQISVDVHNLSQGLASDKQFIHSVLVETRNNKTSDRDEVDNQRRDQRSD